MKTRTVMVAVLLLAVISTAGLLNDPHNRYRLELDYEIGFSGVLFHTIQFGQTGTVLDYVKDEGQDVLFPYERYTAGLGIGRHTVYISHLPFKRKCS
ncbi:hypothetical protein [Mesotoga sp. B105.6.4]|uniref:hypothetical protein n=1 Tax=Mesotoga sp. B105.6.4 TaxID=1582224 RepID=UPI002155B6BB|nr:hypothetical protein [Mesotoga sp. B105.6.4]